MYMKKTIRTIAFLLAVCCMSSLAATAQTTESKTKTTTMKTYVIEREIAGAAALNGEQLKAISQKSCSVLTEMGPGIQWLQSYVAGDKIYCVYKAENEELIREHAKKGGFPANKITEVANIISPATAKD
jgi:hypothetical protein